MLGGPGVWGNHLSNRPFCVFFFQTRGGGGEPGFDLLLFFPIPRLGFCLTKTTSFGRFFPGMPLSLWFRHKKRGDTSPAFPFWIFLFVSMPRAPFFSGGPRGGPHGGGGEKLPPPTRGPHSECGGGGRTFRFFDFVFTTFRGTFGGVTPGGGGVMNKNPHRPLGSSGGASGVWPR